MDATCLSERKYRHLVGEYTAMGKYPRTAERGVSDKYFFMKDYKLVDSTAEKPFSWKDVSRKVCCRIHDQSEEMNPVMNIVLIICFN